MLQLAVHVPGVGCVDVLLELAHFGEQGVKVGVRVRHLGGDFVEAFNFVVDLSYAVANVFDHRLRLVQRGFLEQDSYRVAGGEGGLSVTGLIEPRHDLEDGGFTGAVRADHTDFGSGEKRHRDVVENDFVANRFAGLDHRVNEFRHMPQSIWPNYFPPFRTAPHRPRYCHRGLC